MRPYDKASREAKATEPKAEPFVKKSKAKAAEKARDADKAKTEE
jgi:hypothetical protein